MESKILTIRKTSFEDLKYFADWETREDVKEFLSIEETRSYEEIVRESILYGEDPAKLQFTIVLKEENAPIGRIYISRIDPHADSLDITRIYIADKKYRGRGFGEEAMRLLLEHCFTDLGMERVTLDHYTGNTAAASLYLKLGFQYEGVARGSCRKNGKYYDVELMSMLRKEYFERTRE